MCLGDREGVRPNTERPLLPACGLRTRVHAGVCKRRGYQETGPHLIRSCWQSMNHHPSLHSLSTLAKRLAIPDQWEEGKVGKGNRETVDKCSDWLVAEEIGMSMFIEPHAYSLSPSLSICPSLFLASRDTEAKEIKGFLALRKLVRKKTFPQRTPMM